jgi:hypothetical protein
LKKTLFLLSALFIFACSSDDSSNDNSVDPVDDTNPIYLAENGVTIKAREWAEVGNVTECISFSYGASAWTLPQPNFTNCNPN